MSDRRSRERKATGTDPKLGRAAREIAASKANKALTVIAAARAVLAAPAGDTDARKRLGEALEEYDRSGR